MFDDWGFFTHSTQADGSVRQTTATQSIGLVDTTGGLGSVRAIRHPVTRPDTAVSGFTDPLTRNLAALTGPFGEPTDITGFDGLLTDIDRDRNGNPLTATQPNGRVEVATYDARGKPL